MRNPVIQFLIVIVLVVIGVIVSQSLSKNQGAQPMSSASPSANPSATPSFPVPLANTQATIHTTMGDIVIAFYPEDAPKTVTNFVELAKKGYYDGLIFHRVIKGFMDQGGDPNGTGTGGQSIYGRAFADELNPNAASYKNGYKDGVVAMANAGPNTNGSQFFIMAADYPLPNNYTIFGHVVAGLDVVHAINNVATDSSDKPVKDVVMTKVTVEEK